MFPLPLTPNSLFLTAFMSLLKCPHLFFHALFLYRAGHKRVMFIALSIGDTFFVSFLFCSGILNFQCNTVETELQIEEKNLNFVVHLAFYCSLSESDVLSSFLCTRQMLN